MERLFDAIRLAMPKSVECKVIVMPFLSRGIFKRVWNGVHTFLNRGPINHITGDVHYVAFGLPGSRTLLTIHDCGNLHRLSGWKRTLMKWVWFSGPIGKVRYVSAISEATKRDLIELVGCAESKIRVIPDCITSDFKPNPKPWPNDKPIALMIGAAPNKNLARMAKALEGLPIKVELVGNPSEAQKTIFQEAGVELKVLGRLSDEAIVEAYNRCDFLLFASTLEGFGMPILEAQVTGRPVITSNCSSMPEVAGESACLVDPYSIESIREGVLKVLADATYRHRLVEAGYKNASRFSAETVAAQYATLYAEIAANAP